ncbi:MAG: Gfo/Idh/MocA family protein [Gemmatimonadota bacterium]
MRRAEAYRREHDGYRSYGSYEGALGDDGVDAVLVLTPPARHLEPALAALRAGKHVIVEKPPFLDTVEFDRAAEAARETGRQLMVAENYYYKPVRRRVAECVRRGDVGEVLFVQVNAVKEQETSGWRDDPGLAGGGALFEGGIHWVDFVANLGITLERAAGRVPDGSAAGPERSVLVDLDYAEGAVGSLAYSWEVPSPLGGARFSRIYGREGSIFFESNGGFVAVHGERTRFWPVPGGLKDAAGYRPMFRDFLDALRADRAPEYDLELARRDLELVEQIYDSMER